MPLIAKLPGPTFVSVTALAPLTVPTARAVNVMLAGLRETAVPVPLSDTVCGLPRALSLMDNTAVRVPAAWGVNLTLMVQVNPAPRVAPQVVVREKSPALVPVIVMLLRVSVAVPVLRTVTFVALLVVKSSRSSGKRNYRGYPGATQGHGWRAGHIVTNGQGGAP